MTIRCSKLPEVRLRVEVTDQGAGISPDMLNRLFVPFERLGAEATQVEGTGLGLALSKGLVEAMGGTLGVESTPGTGSTFFIELSLSEAPGSDEDWSEAAQPVPLRTLSGTHTLLYVEDNMANLTLIERALSRRPDITLLSAMQGRIGLELARQREPDLILLDLHLPDLPGEDFLRHLRGDPVTRDIPVVVLSADATPGQRQRLLAAGARAYLTKPLDMRVFFQLIDETLQERKLDNTG